MLSLNLLDYGFGESRVKLDSTDVGRHRMASTSFGQGKRIGLGLNLCKQVGWRKPQGRQPIWNLEY